MLHRNLEGRTEAAIRQQQSEQSLHIHRSNNLKPLTLQLEELMLSLPPSLCSRPWAMEDFLNRLEGRYRNRPHPANVGLALRKLGWVRRRDWSANGGGRRFWYVGK